MQNAHSYKKFSKHPLLPCRQASQTSLNHASAATSDRPIPLVSSVSRDSAEDFELTPLRDRMRAFTAEKQPQPASKPVLAPAKTVSPPARHSLSSRYGRGNQLAGLATIDRYTGWQKRPN